MSGAQGKLWVAAATAILLAGLAPPAQADLGEHLLPPEALRADYNATAQTIHLAWLPPGNDTMTPFVYAVYRNGESLGTTTATWYDAILVGSLNAFQVTSSSNGNESAPSAPVIAQQNSSGGNAGTTWLMGPGPLDYDTFFCEVAGVWTLTTFPFVSVTIHEQCVPILGPALDLGGILDAGIVGEWG